MENGILSRGNTPLSGTKLMQGWDGENQFIDGEETGKLVWYMSMALFLGCLITIWQ